MTTVSVTGDRLVPQGVGTRRTALTGAGAVGINLPQDTRVGSGELIRGERPKGGGVYMNRNTIRAAWLAIYHVARGKAGWTNTLLISAFCVAINMVSVQRTYAAVSDCGGSTWVSGGTMQMDLTVPWPANDMAPEAPAGFLRGSGYSRTVTCHMPDGYNQIIYFSGVRSSGGDIWTGTPGVFNDISPMGSFGVGTGSVILSCSGKTSNVGTYPVHKADTANFHGYYISIPCENGTDGTVTATLTITPGTIVAAKNGSLSAAVDNNYKPGNQFCYLLGGCAGIGMSTRSLQNNVRNTTDVRPIFSYIRTPPVNNWGNWACTTTVSDGGLLDWGVLAPPATPNATVGQSLGAEKMLTVTVSCPKDPTGTPWAITGGVYQIRGNVAGPNLQWLGSNNQSIAFEIKDQALGNAVVPVGTAETLQTGDISTANAGQTLLLNKSLTFTPIIASTPLQAGKTTAMATIDVWMRNH